MGFIRWNWENYCLMWRKSFDFRGVTPRNQYWGFSLVQIVLIFGGLLLFNIAISLAGQGKPLTLAGPPHEPLLIFLFVVYLMYSWGSFLPGLSSQTRRIRDATGHWAWMLLIFIPWLGILATSVICLCPTRKSLD